MYTKTLALSSEDEDIRLVVKQTTVKVHATNPSSDTQKVVILLIMINRPPTADNNVETVFYKKVAFVQRGAAESKIQEMAEDAEAYYKLVKNGKHLLFKFSDGLVKTLSENLKF